MSECALWMVRCVCVWVSFGYIIQMLFRADALFFSLLLLLLKKLFWLEWPYSSLLINSLRSDDHPMIMGIRQIKQNDIPNAFWPCLIEFMDDSFMVLFTHLFCLSTKRSGGFYCETKTYLARLGFWSIAFFRIFLHMEESYPSHSLPTLCRTAFFASKITIDHIEWTLIGWNLFKATKTSNPQTGYLKMMTVLDSC